MCPPPTVSDLLGGKVAVSNVRNLLRKLGVEFTDPEYINLLRMLPVDGKT